MTPSPFSRSAGFVRRLDGLQRGLLAAVVALAFACLVVLLPIGGSISGSEVEIPPPPLPPPVPERTAPATPFEYDVIVERNPFTPDREAPARAWSPAAVAAEQAAANPERPTGPPPHLSYRLLGTVVTGSPAAGFAVIEADPRRPGPERYRLGQRIGPYRVRRIAPDRVVLSGGAVLRLKPHPGAEEEQATE